jgi:tRNA(Ile2) C34 agmatinyltransferase TiaS
MELGTLYFTVVVLAVLICLVATAVWKPPTRVCPSCGEDTGQQGKRCKHCGYSFSQVQV